MEQVNGNHHLTMSVGPAQEDYDFHTRALGMRSIKKTVLFDGQAPIYHLYYGNADGTASSVLTTFPFRQAGVMGRRGTNQVKVINLAVPEGSLPFWEGRLADHGIVAERSSLLGTERLASPTRAASPTRWWRWRATPGPATRAAGSARTPRSTAATA